ncbi:IclR family transcriptional regulator [Deferrisoma sp.]
MAESSGYRPPAVVRAMDVVEILSQGRPQRLSELARVMGVGKSTLLGILNALEERGWVERRGRLYVLGPELLRVARRAYGLWNVAGVARPFLEPIAADLGVTALVGVPAGDRVRIEDCVPGGQGMRVQARPGEAVPFFAPATAKALLAALPPERGRALLGRRRLPRFTDRSRTDPETFWAEVEQARERGYAEDNGEYLEGVRAVAAAVRVGGDPVALVWAVGFGAGLTEAGWQAAGRRVREAADAIARALARESAQGGPAAGPGSPGA